MTRRLQTLQQKNRWTSAWPQRTRLMMATWALVWALLYRTSPKPLNAWRVFLLRAFGANIGKSVYVSSTSKVKMPWRLTMHERSALGDFAEVYNLGVVVIGARSTVAQYVYLCAGEHDLSQPALPLVLGPITIGDQCFIGAKALILPGVTIGNGAVVGAGAVVTKDVAEWTIVGGNPAKPIKQRPVMQVE